VPPLAAGNLHKALRMLVDHCRKAREKEMMDLADGAGVGGCTSRTQLTIAWKAPGFI
jgi:endonuclease III